MMKKNAKYRVIESREVPVNNTVISDEIIKFVGVYSGKHYPSPLRRIVYYSPERDRYFVYVTNNMVLAASTIAEIYKERWNIEIFFKHLKQRLKIKTFVGTSENAVKIQIWTALIAMLILVYLRMKSTFNWSISNLAALLRMNLFTYRDLWEWINQPFETPPIRPEPVQMELQFS